LVNNIKIDYKTKKLPLNCGLTTIVDVTTIVVAFPLTFSFIKCANSPHNVILATIPLQLNVSFLNVLLNTKMKIYLTIVLTLIKEAQFLEYLCFLDSCYPSLFSCAELVKYC
jgi:hypothetical protein